MSRPVPLFALVAMFLLGVPLAGCLGGPAVNPTSGAEGNDSPTTIRDPGNYTYVGNASFATGGHVHDYWDGTNRKVVVDATEPVFRQWISAPVLGGGPGPVATFRPEPGTVVPQGTDTVEVRISWTDQPENMFSDPELWIKTAADRTLRPVSDVTNGATVTVNVSNDDNDLPHRELSAWRFALVIDGVGAADIENHQYRGEVTIHAEAVRGLPLPVFPAHPNLWNGREKISLLDESRERFLWLFDTSCAGSCKVVLGWPRPVHTPDNGTIVPFNASRVRVTLTVDNANPTRIDLLYHGADTREWTRLEPDEVADDGRTRIYEIPVTDEMGDGPYDEQSLWAFTIYTSEPRDGTAFFGGYRMQATALRTR